MKQVLDINQMRHLQELGLDTSNASMAFCMFDDDDSKHLLPNNQDVFERCVVTKYIPAYTLQDVLELLPKELKLFDRRCWLRMDLSDGCVYYYYEDSSLVEQRVILFNGGEDISLLEAAYRMLYWCIKQGYVKTNKGRINELRY